MLAHVFHLRRRRSHHARDRRCTDTRLSRIRTLVDLRLEVNVFDSHSVDILARFFLRYLLEFLLTGIAIFLHFFHPFESNTLQ